MDRGARLHFTELVEVDFFQPVADHVGLGDDIGCSRLVGKQSHFAEDYAGPTCRQVKRAVLAFDHPFDTDTALQKENHEIGLVAVFDQRGSGVKGAAGHAGFQHLQFTGREVGQDSEIAERYFVLADAADEVTAQDVVLGMAQRGVEVFGLRLYDSGDPSAFLTELGVSYPIGDGATLCEGGAESNEDYLYVLYNKLGGETPEEQAGSFVAETLRALELKASNHVEWQEICKRAGSARFSWSKSARATIEQLYEQH